MNKLKHLDYAVVIVVIQLIVISSMLKTKKYKRISIIITYLILQWLRTKLNLVKWVLQLNLKLGCNSVGDEPEKNKHTTISVRLSSPKAKLVKVTSQFYNQAATNEEQKLGDQQN